MQELDKLLSAIIAHRIKLSKLAYNNPKYDVLEEKLHDLEDTFLDNFSKPLERVLVDIHKKYRLDTEILSPLAYIAKNYVALGKDTEGREQYDLLQGEEGLDIDENTRLAFLPNPARLVMYKGTEKKIVWNSL